MCDPVSMLVGAVGGAALGRRSSGATAPAQPDPAAEQAAAEARAAQAANAKLAQDQQRRRQQQSLIAKGAPTAGPTLGDVGDATASPLSAGGMNRSTSARRTQSLLSRGATASGGPAVVASRSSGGMAYVNEA